MRCRSHLLNAFVITTSSLQTSANQFWPRANADYVAPATVSGVATNFASGAKAVTAQLKADANAAVEAFSSAVGTSLGDANTQSTQETVNLLNNIVKGAIAYPINQNIGSSATPSQDRLNSMATAINNTLNSIDNTATKLLSQTDGAVHYSDLKDCINGLVQQGGLQTGESCVMNGMSITGVSGIMTSVLKTFGSQAIPSSVLSQVTKALDPTFTAIIPGEQDFYDSVNNAITSVQASVSGQLVAALNDAQNCFETSAKSGGTYAEKLALTQACTRSPTGKSVYNDLKTLYLSVTNQFVGYLQPNIIDSIHTIANNYLDESDPASDEAYARKAIAAATSSIVASNAGNQVTYAYALANCMDSVIGVTDPHLASNIAATKNCLSKPTGPAASVQQIVYGYIQQIYGVLPAALASKIEATGVAKLNPSDANYNSQVEALHAKFTETDPGAEYVTCYEAFVDCLFNSGNGALEHPGNTQSVCLLGDSCKKAPDGKANLAVPIGRRSPDYAAHFNRRSIKPTPTRRQTVQQAKIVRKYHVSTPHRSYLLTSFNSVFGTSSTLI